MTIDELYCNIRGWYKRGGKYYIWDDPQEIEITDAKKVIDEFKLALLEIIKGVKFLTEVWVVGVGDCEGGSVIAVCATKEIAERELFNKRDSLIAEWKEADIRSQESIKEFCEEKNKEVWEDTMYRDMITALSGNDYEKWDNFPHDTPYLYKTEVKGVESTMKAITDLFNRETK